MLLVSVILGWCWRCMRRGAGSETSGESRWLTSSHSSLRWSSSAGRHTFALKYLFPHPEKEMCHFRNVRNSIHVSSDEVYSEQFGLTQVRIVFLFLDFEGRSNELKWQFEVNDGDMKDTNHLTHLKEMTIIFRHLGDIAPSRWTTFRPLPLSAILRRSLLCGSTSPCAFRRLSCVAQISALLGGHIVFFRHNHMDKWH